MGVGTVLFGAARRKEGVGGVMSFAFVIIMAAVKSICILNFDIPALFIA